MQQGQQCFIALDTSLADMRMPWWMFRHMKRNKIRNELNTPDFTRCQKDGCRKDEVNWGGIEEK